MKRSRARFSNREISLWTTQKIDISMFADSVRIVGVVVTFILITIDCFQQFSLSLRPWVFMEHGIFSALQFIAALACSGVITNALLSLWQGTSLMNDLMDYEPDAYCL
jgi:hypothetical protein